MVIEGYREYIREILGDCIRQNKRKFVIYPNGEIANVVKQVLEETYHITPAFTVDNR